MPKKAIDFSKTIIYKIVCNDLSITDCYIGHTTDFTKRKSCHKSRCNNANCKEYNLNVYQFIRNNGGWDNWCMIEIEKYACNNNNESCTREKYWLEILNATLNKQIPSRTQTEYQDCKKEKIKEYQTEYNKINKDKRKEYQTEYNKQYYIIKSIKNDVAILNHFIYLKLYLT